MLKEWIFRFAERNSSRIGLDLPYFFKNGFWTLLRQIGVNGISFAVTILFTHNASQAVYGEYQLILSLLATISILSLPGLNTSLMMAVVKGKDGNYKDVVKKSFSWSILGVPFLVVLGIYYYASGREAVGIALIASAVFFPFIYAFNTWDIFLMGKSKFDLTTKYSVVHALCNGILTVGAILLYRDNLLLILLAYLASYAIFNVLYYRLSLKHVVNNNKDEEVISYGYFLTKINVLSIIADNIDRVLIGTFLLPSRLAIYSAGILFTKQIQTVSKGMLGVLIPKQVQRGSIPKGGYLKIGILGVIIAAISYILFGWLIPVFLPSTYDESILIAKISIIFYPFFLVSNVYSNQFIFSNNKAVLLNYTVLSSGIRVACTIIILPLFGIYGLAALSGVQQVISSVLLYWLSLRHQAGKGLPLAVHS